MRYLIYTVTCNPAIDYITQLEGPLKLGRTNRNMGQSVQFGGKGINVSVVLQNLGQQTTALGFVAGFTGDGLENGLRNSGLPTDFIRVKEGLTRINVKIKALEETEINGMGPVITEDDLQKLYVKLDKLTGEDMLILSGSVPVSLGAHTYSLIMDRLHERNIPVVVDATKGLLTNTLKFKPFLIKPNLQELEEMVGRKLDSQDTVVDAAMYMQSLGARNVLVSMAGEGALLLDETGKTYRMGCPAGNVVNSVGAGDSMVAGFVTGYLQTGDYYYALRLGTAAGSATAFSIGLADKEMIMKLLSQL